MRTTPRSFPRPLVICLHSSAATGRQWQPLVERLAPYARVVAPDLHGHGDGPPWRGDGDILAADAELVAALARESDGPVHLVGHSWGGAVAFRALRAEPHRFASVAAWEPVLFRLLRDRGERRAPGAPVAAIGRALQADLRAGLRHVAAARFVDFWNGPGAFAALAPMRRDAVAARMPAAAAHFAALWHDDAKLADYASLTLPARLYAGSRTHAATRTIVELLASVVPGATVARMTAMGHMGPVTHPHTVAQAMAAFVAAQAGDFASVARAA
jgi:pimeloyl-ACP methyl ester carboxylesterase